MSDHVPEMVERVARAMARHCEGLAATPGEKPAWEVLHFESLDAFVDASWRNYVSQAVAGMEAMMEPTEVMVREGYCEPYVQGHSTNLIWRAMLKTALGGDR